eukprot:7264067-Prorocentrum_lima.AAC.1
MMFEAKKVIIALERLATLPKQWPKDNTKAPYTIASCSCLAAGVAERKLEELITHHFTTPQPISP